MSKLLVTKEKTATRSIRTSVGGSLKHRVVELFLYQDSLAVFKDLEKLFGNYLEPVRPGRKYPRIQKQAPNVKYYTLTNYKRAL